MRFMRPVQTALSALKKVARSFDVSLGKTSDQRL